MWQGGFFTDVLNDEVHPVCTTNAYDNIKINKSELPPYPLLDHRADDDLLNVVLRVVLTVGVKWAEEHIKNVMAGLLDLSLNTVGIVKVSA